MLDFKRKNLLIVFHSKLSLPLSIYISSKRIDKILRKSIKGSQNYIVLVIKLMLRFGLVLQSVLNAVGLNQIVVYL